MWEPEVLKVHEFFTEPLSMEGKYAVKLSITELIKINRKLRKRYNGRLWKMQMWSYAYMGTGRRRESEVKSKGKFL